MHQGQTQRLMISGITRTNRFAAMAAIDDLVAAAGGWIEGHTLFSNRVAVFRMVLPAHALSGLAASLEALAIRLGDGDADRLAALPQGADSTAEIIVSLNLTFIHDEPDLSRPVPAVPG